MRGRGDTVIMAQAGLNIAVVKKTFRYSNGFFYNRLYRNSLFRNFIMESGISVLIITDGLIWAGGNANSVQVTLFLVQHRLAVHKGQGLSGAGR